MIKQDKIYWLPDVDQKINLPVWSECVSLLESKIAHIISCVLGLVVSCIGAISGSTETGIPIGDIFQVDRNFSNSWSRWPLALAILFGKFLQIKEVVRSDHVTTTTCLFRIAWRRVDLVGLKQATYQYWTKSALVLTNFSTPLSSRRFSCSISYLSIKALEYIVVFKEIVEELFLEGWVFPIIYYWFVYDQR